MKLLKFTITLEYEYHPENEQSTVDEVETIISDDMREILGDCDGIAKIEVKCEVVDAT